MSKLTQLRIKGELYWKFPLAVLDTIGSKIYANANPIFVEKAQEICVIAQRRYYQDGFCALHEAELKLLNHYLTSSQMI